VKNRLVLVAALAVAVGLTGCLGPGAHPVAQTGDFAAPPGLWRTGGSVPGDQCRWARIAADGSTIASGPPFTWDGVQYVQLPPSDSSFQTDGCFDWVQVPGPWGGPMFPDSPNHPSFGPGEFVVNYDIAPGTYRSDGADMSKPLPACAWWRLSGFGGTEDQWIEYRYTYVPEEQLVTIAPGDVGFASTGCTPWTHVG
jgi:hypothetical protein